MIKGKNSKLKKVFQNRLVNYGWGRSGDITDDNVDTVWYTKGRDAVLADDGGIFLFVDGQRVAGWAWDSMRLFEIQSPEWKFPNDFVYVP